jgi:hypothetical protein
MREAAAARQRRGLRVGIDTSSGVRIGIPHGLLKGPSPHDFGSDYVANENRISIRHYRTTSELGVIFLAYKNVFAGVSVSYAVRRDEWFVLAGEHRQRNFCVRFHKREDALAGFYAVYEQAQAQAFRPAVLMSSLTL